MIALAATLLTSVVVCQIDTKALDQECGDPKMESSSILRLTGVVIRVVNADTVVIRETRGKLWNVRLAGVGGQENEDAVRTYLTKTVLEKRVTFWGKPFPKNDSPYEAVIIRKRTDVNRYLISHGLVKYRESDDDYAVSSHWLCVLGKLEEKAKLAKVGVWADR